MTSLDIAVSSAIMRLHALERALHDEGPWEMEFRGVRVPANRFVFNDHIQFCATFPPMPPYLFFGSVELLCGGETVALQPMPGWVCDTPNTLDWVMELDDRVFAVTA